MAFAQGQNVEIKEKKLYIGVANCKVLSINPGKQELEDILHTSIATEPVYLSTDDRGRKTLRLRFLVQPIAGYTDNKGEAITKIFNADFFLRQAARQSNKMKYQVIDPYCRTAWVTKEQLEKHEIPIYSTGLPADIASTYRPCYDGEEALTLFVKNYRNIPNYYIWTMDMNNKKPIADVSQAEARFDHMGDLFKEDYKELHNLFFDGQDRVVKLLITVKTTEKGQFNNVYTKTTFKANTRNFTKCQRELAQYPVANTEFDFSVLHEYSPIQATNLETPTTAVPPANYDDVPF